MLSEIIRGNYYELRFQFQLHNIISLTSIHNTHDSSKETKRRRCELQFHLPCLVVAWRARGVRERRNALRRKRQATTYWCEEMKWATPKRVSHILLSKDEDDDALLQESERRNLWKRKFQVFDLDTLTIRLTQTTTTGLVARVLCHETVIDNFIIHLSRKLNLSCKNGSDDFVRMSQHFFSSSTY